MKLELKTKRLPTGRPRGINQPDGPERIKRKLPVIYDSILKRALGGDAPAARLALEITGELPMNNGDKIQLLADLRKVAEENVARAD